MSKVRVAVFGSFYRGYYVLNELLMGDIADQVEVVGVATDDPASTFISADKRVWQTRTPPTSGSWWKSWLGKRAFRYSPNGSIRSLSTRS